MLCRRALRCSISLASFSMRCFIWQGGRLPQLCQASAGELRRGESIEGRLRPLSRLYRVIAIAMYVPGTSLAGPKSELRGGS